MSESKPRVLIVDDEIDLRDTMRDWLTRAGYPALCAEDGVEALDLAAREPIDVVVTDFMMPRMDGLELLARLRERHPAIQVIFLTGQATKELAIEALRQGRSYDFLEKPLHDVARLARLIDQAWIERQGQAAPATPSGSWSTEPSLPPQLQASIARSQVLASVFGYTLAHLAEPLSLAVVAGAVGYNPTYLTDLVRRETGQTLARWINELRMREAQRLLATRDSSIAQVATAVGFDDPGHFGRLFRQFSGETPSAWRDARR